MGSFKKNIKYNDVDASPSKSFFVSMLTRDISLTDAILDLLDNCVDGIMRSEADLSGNKPYKRFYANIDFDKDIFSIEDNCGGIPVKLHSYAFRMGRPREDNGDIVVPKGSVGTYGIGMKRAIFKIGQQCLITSKNGIHNYEVDISNDWLWDENDYSLPVRASEKSMKQDGTVIVVDNLHPGVADYFGPNKKSFMAELIEKIETHYAYIIDKGFVVKLNGEELKSRSVRLIFGDLNRNKVAIQPYIYRARDEGVDIFIAVGFTRPIPTDQEIEREREKISSRYSKEYAGWTILCNERAVLFSDKSEITGWGQGNVPKYHPQFIGISGIVDLYSDDPSKLPTTTTKRGIDVSSRLYLRIRERMMEGIKEFIRFTNVWKKNLPRSKEYIQAGDALTLQEIKKISKDLEFNQVRKGTLGEHFKPKLPMPKKESDSRKIIFNKKIRDIRLVSDYLFDNEEEHPSIVGEECFDRVLREAKR